MLLSIKFSAEEDAPIGIIFQSFLAACLGKFSASGCSGQKLNS